MEDLVSILMPAFNAERYIAKAIMSILYQTYSNFELIVIDDGSCDSTADICKTFNDKRIRYYYQDNKGISSALNNGLIKCRGDLVARQDADDLSLPNRLEIQVRYLKENPNTVLVGSCANVIDTDGRMIGRLVHPSKCSDIRLCLPFENVYVHSSVIYRREAVLTIGGYPEGKKLSPPEDYSMLSMLSLVGSCANLPQRLVSYRHHKESVSKNYSELISVNCEYISARYIHALTNGAVDIKVCQLASSFFVGRRIPLTIFELVTIARVVTLIYRKFCVGSGYGSFLLLKLLIYALIKSLMPEHVRQKIRRLKSSSINS